MINHRIDNLSICEASYLGNKPEHPSYHINLYKPNYYYGKEHLFIEDGDYYKYKEPEYVDCRIHKSCFKNRQYCYAIASFNWDESESFYELHFIGNRPLELDAEEVEIFWKLIRLGDKTLNKNE